MLWVKLPLSDYLILGTSNAFLSVYSDLLESFLKRCAGVKVSITSFNFLGLELDPARSWRLLRQTGLAIATFAVPAVVHVCMAATHFEPPGKFRAFDNGPAASQSASRRLTYSNVKIPFADS